MSISIKTPREIEIMKEGGSILAAVMAGVAEKARQGATTKDLDRAAKALVLSFGAQPAFLGYEGYPATLCASVNDEVVHALPSGRALQDGDIISLDLGVIWKGFYLDMARTVPVGSVSQETLHLIHATKKALRLALKKVHPGATIGDIGNTIERFILSQGLSVVKELCGHGIGRELHEEPQIPNYGDRHTGAELKEGMVIAIEPIVAMGGWQVKMAKDGYAFLTLDGSPAAHFEDTVAVTADGVEVLTKNR